MLTQKDMPALIEMLEDKIKSETGSDLQLEALMQITADMLESRLKDQIKFRLEGLSPFELTLLIDEIHSKIDSKKKDPKSVKQKKMH